MTEMMENIRVLKTYYDTLGKQQNINAESAASLDVKFLKKVDASLSFFENFKLRDYLNDSKELHSDFKLLTNKNSLNALNDFPTFAIKEFMINLENQLLLKFSKFLNILNLLSIHTIINFELLKNTDSSKISSDQLTEIVSSTNKFLFFNQCFCDHFNIHDYDSILSECNFIIPLTLLADILEKTIKNNNFSSDCQSSEYSFVTSEENHMMSLRGHLSTIISFHLVNPNLFKSFESSKSKIYQKISFKNEFLRIWRDLFSQMVGNDTDTDTILPTEGVSKNFDDIMKAGILQLISSNASLSNDFPLFGTPHISNVEKLLEIHDFFQSLVELDCPIMDDSDDENYLIDSSNSAEAKSEAIFNNTSQLIRLYSYIMDDIQVMELFCQIFIVKFGSDAIQHNGVNESDLSSKLEDFFPSLKESISPISARFTVDEILHYLNNKIIEFELLRSRCKIESRFDNISSNNSKINNIQNSNDSRLRFKILFEFLDQSNLNFRSWFPLSKLESDNSYEMNLILFLKASLNRIYYDLSHFKDDNSLDLFTENIIALHLEFHETGCKFNLLSLFNDITYKLCDVIMKDSLYDASSTEGISWYSSKLLELKLCESVGIQPKWNYIFPVYDSKLYEAHELSDRFLKQNHMIGCLELCISILSILISKIHITNENDTPIMKQMLTINILILETSIKLNNDFLKHFSLINMYQLINGGNNDKGLENSDKSIKRFRNLGILIKLLNSLIEIDLNSINLSIIIYEYLIFEAKIPVKDNTLYAEELKTFLTVLQVMFDPKLQFSFSRKLDNYLNGISKINERNFTDSDVDQSTLKSNAELKNAFLTDSYDDDCESSISSAVTRTNNTVENLEETKAEEDTKFIELNSFLNFLKLNKLENLELENYNKSKEINFNNRSVSSYNTFTPPSNR